MTDTPYPSGVLVTETPDSITFFDSRYVDYQVRKDSPQFDAVVAALRNSDIEGAISAARPAVALLQQIADEQIADEFMSRPIPRQIQFTDWGMTIDGEGVHGHVVERFLQFRRSGVPYQPLLNFITKLFENPSDAARLELYAWLEGAEMPITPDGDFIAYKRVRPDYRDIHSGRFDNSIGRVVSMPRSEVDEDRRRTCSTGLHFCSKGYLPHFSSSGSGDHILLVKINPADVVAIPVDHNEEKGRTWRYEVVGEVTLEEAGVPWVEPIYGEYDDDYEQHYDDSDDYDDDEYEDDSDDYEVEVDDDQQVNPEQTETLMRIMGVWTEK